MYWMDFFLSQSAKPISMNINDAKIGQPDIHATWRNCLLFFLQNAFPGRFEAGFDGGNVKGFLI